MDRAAPLTLVKVHSRFAPVSERQVFVCEGFGYLKALLSFRQSIS